MKEKLTIRWGKGSRYGSFYPILELAGAQRYVFGVRTSEKHGYVELDFADLRNKLPFIEEGKMTELINRVEAIPGVDLPPDVARKYPSVYLSVLINPEAMRLFLESMTWAISEIRNSTL